MAVCSKCGSENKKSTKFCTSCGALVKDDVKQNQDAAPGPNEEYAVPSNAASVNRRHKKALKIIAIVSASLLIIVISLVAILGFAAGPKWFVDSYHVYALDAKTGAEKWNFRTEYRIDSCPVVANENVYFGTSGDAYYALDAGTGVEKWRHETGCSDLGSAVANGMVYFIDSGETLYALDAETGAEKWTYGTKGRMNTSPAVVDGLVYCGGQYNNNYFLFALDANTGTEIWKYKASGSIQTTPVVTDGMVYLASNDDYICALDADTGAEEWKYNTGEYGSTALAAADGIVCYISYGVEKLYALDADTGAEIWIHKVGGETGMESDLVIFDGGIYCGSPTGIFALDAETGDEYWKYSIHNVNQGCCPAVNDSAVYYILGYISALDINSGTEIWTTEISEYLTSPAVADGTVFFGEH